MYTVNDIKTKDEFKKIIGSNVRRYRKLRSITTKELSEFLNIDIKSLTRIERGDVFTHVYNLHLICMYLDIDIGELFLERK